MTAILDFLKTEREQFIAITEAFMVEQKTRYSQLSPELNEQLDFIHEYLIRGGKWHRAVLGGLAYRFVGGDETRDYRKGILALEIMHRFLLVHDDLMDQDLYRHGGPTLERVYQERLKKRYPSAQDSMYSKGMAMIAGDLVHSMVGELVSRSHFSPEIRLAAIQAFHTLVMETAAGWQMQTEQNLKPIHDVTEADFFKGMQLVSAHYSVVWPLRLGQLFAGRLTQEAWDKQLDIYGWQTGAAFQIMDDILGMFGKPEETGKPVGHDYREGKKTFLVLYAFNHGSPQDRQWLQKTLGSDIDPATLKKVQQLMQQTGAVEYAKQQALHHVQEAQQALAQVKTSDQEAVELLNDLAELLANREY